MKAQQGLGAGKLADLVVSLVVSPAGLQLLHALLHLRGPLIALCDLACLPPFGGLLPGLALPHGGFQLYAALLPLRLQGFLLLHGLQSQKAQLSDLQSTAMFGSQKVHDSWWKHWGFGGPAGTA